MRRAVLLLIALLVVIHVTTRPASTAQAVPIPGRVAFLRSGDLWIWEAEQERRLTDSGGVSSPRFSSDGHHVAFIREEALWVVKLGSAPRKVSGKNFSSAGWSPAANLLAFAERGDVYTVRITDDGPGTPQVLVRGWTEPAWSPDGRLVAVARNTQRENFTGTSEIGVVSAAGGQPRVIWQGEFLQDVWVGPARGLKWSADGQWLAFYRSGLTASLSADTNQLNVVPVQGGRVTPLALGPMNPAYFRWAPDGATLAYTDGVGRFAWSDKKIKVISMPPTANISSPTPSGYADREPAWAPRADAVFFIRSVAQSPDLMYQPAPEQAVWRFAPRTGQQQVVAGTEGALGVQVGPGGELLWPRGDGKSASLWTAGRRGAVEVVGQVDFPGYYYGQFYWDTVFDWWPGERLR